MVQELVQETVERPGRAFSTLVSVMTPMPRLRQIIAAGSPSQGWARFKKLDATQSAAETNKLPQPWQRLTTKDGEPPNEYCSSGSVLRTRLRSHGMGFTDQNANQHFVRNPFPSFGVQNRVWSPTQGWPVKALKRWSSARNEKRMWL